MDGAMIAFTMDYGVRVFPTVSTKELHFASFLLMRLLTTRRTTTENEHREHKEHRNIIGLSSESRK